MTTVYEKGFQQSYWHYLPDNNKIEPKTERIDSMIKTDLLFLIFGEGPWRNAKSFVEDLREIGWAVEA